METTFQGKKVSSILGILPEHEGLFDDEAENYTFPVKQTMRLKRVMGFDRHRLAKSTSKVSDFGIYGLKYMLGHGWINKDEIGALLVVSLCPDYFVPHNSNIIQAGCGLDRDVICIDMPQGCCGFIIGLTEAFMLLEHMDKKVVLINGDVLTHKISKQDRNEYPVMGDATTITIVENTKDEDKIYTEIHMDGYRREALIIPAGGFRKPSTAETAKMEDCGDGNIRSQNDMYMDGTEVFNFVMQDVPPMIGNILGKSGLTTEQIDYFLFHQPNKFIVKKLGEKLGVPEEKMPNNLVETFGNPSSASIPLVTALNLKNEFISKTYRCCLSGFGTGLSYGALTMKMGNLTHCEIIGSNL